MSKHVRPEPPLPPPFDQVDQEQVKRHHTLLELWRHCTLEELLADMHVLLQLVHFRAHQDTVERLAAVEVAKGAGHDCEEWPTREGRCALCGGSVMFGPGH
jgi:hypothetical protein